MHNNQFYNNTIDSESRVLAAVSYFGILSIISILSLPILLPNKREFVRIHLNAGLSYWIYTVFVTIIFYFVGFTIAITGSIVDDLIIASIGYGIVCIGLLIISLMCILSIVSVIKAISGDYPFVKVIKNIEFIR